MKSNVSGWVRRAACVGAVACAALLASCGGGQPGQRFYPSRIIVFGDELSLVQADGSKYTINALVSGSTTALDCTSNPIWVQTLASVYGLVFPQCPGAVSNPVSQIYAANGASVNDLAGQISQQQLNGGFTASDMVTVLVGGNDVVAEFAKYPDVCETQLDADLDALGTALATQVNLLADTGAKILVSTIPDMGLTPFAGDRSAGSTDSNPALLSRLSARFNDALLAHLTNDGSKIGLIQLDEYLQSTDHATLLGQGTYANTTLPACSVALPACNTNTLVPDAINAAWLWADNRHLTPSGQANLATLAVTRAQNNPF